MTIYCNSDQHKSVFCIGSEPSAGAWLAIVPIKGAVIDSSRELRRVENKSCKPVAGLVLVLVAYAARSVAGWAAGVGHLTGQSSIQQRRAQPCPAQSSARLLPPVSVSGHTGDTGPGSRVPTLRFTQHTTNNHYQQRPGLGSCGPSLCITAGWHGAVWA